MIRRAGRAGAVVAVSLVGCTAATRPPAVEPALAGRQTLYRIQYEDPEGKGSFRLLLRRPLTEGRDERFDLAASDPLGRTLWALEVVDGEGSWFDFRGHRVCPIGRRFRVEALHLPELPLAALPRILAGESPDPDAVLGTEADGRSWSLQHDERGRLVGWTLSEGGRMILRCELEPLGAGGTLVAAGNAESSILRFRRVTEEPLRVAPPLREPPAGFERGGCEAVALP